MRALFVIALSALVLAWTASCSDNRSQESLVQEGRIPRDKNSLIGVDSTTFNSIVYVPGRDGSELAARITDSASTLLAEAGLPSAKSPISYTTAYMTFYADGIQAKYEGGDTTGYIACEFFMQVEQYGYLARRINASNEKPQPTIAVTWKRRAVAYLPISEFDNKARTLAAQWVELFLKEHRTANAE